MLNTRLSFATPAALADYLSNEAAGIRLRVNSGASPTSQRIMRAEAAAYERAASLVANLQPEARP